MDDETEKFIEYTKNFEHSLKAQEDQKAVCQFSREEALASIKYSDIYHNTER